MPCKILTIVTNVVRILLRNIPGCTLRIVMPGEEETTDKATITFVKDLKKSGISRPEPENKPFRSKESQQVIEDVIQDIMRNRGVSREEAERILANPW